MNLSGRAVSRICREYGVKLDRVLVAHDEMDLPLGRFKFKVGGGDAGHNGISSIAECLGTPDFARLRLGVGRPAEDIPTPDYVLSDFDEGELPVLRETLLKARDSLAFYFAQGSRRP